MEGISMNRFLLGIDIGTSACKVALFTPDGHVVAQESRPYQVYYPNPGWAEQDPEDWWRAVSEALRSLLDTSGIDPKEICGIGIDGQGWSAVAIDVEGNVLCNSPIWLDTRADEICDEWNRGLDPRRIFEVCGNPLRAAYTLPKILWMKRHNPDVYRRIHKILQSNSYLVYKLTGVLTQDISQAYAYQCFDMRKGQWDKSICDLFEIDINILPDISSCHQVVGGVTEEAAVITGLAEGTPVVAGGLDAACGALGVGVIHAGETQEQGGQAGGMSICMGTYKADPRLILSFHVVPNMWLLQGGTVGGGGVYRWFEQEFGAQERVDAARLGTDAMEEMDNEAETIMDGSDGMIFLPYMAGERSPIWDTKAKGVFYGIDYTKSRAHFIRSSMEGVAFSLKHNIDVAESAGVEVGTLRAMGGAANSRLWTQIKADVTGKRIVVPSSDTATTLGAAILAGVGTGVYESFESAVSQTVKIQREHKPDQSKHDKYYAVYRKYKEIYSCLADTMHE